MTLHLYSLYICLLDDSVMILYSSRIFLNIFMTLSWHVFASAEFYKAGGNVISDPNPAERKTPVGDGRVARVLLDPAQYHQAMLGGANFHKKHVTDKSLNTCTSPFKHISTAWQDLEGMAAGKQEIYSTLNLVMRRKPPLAAFPNPNILL